MQTKIQHLFVPIALIAVLIALVLYIFNDQPEPIPSSEKITQTESELSDTLPMESVEDSQEPDELTELDSDFKAARRIKTVNDIIDKPSKSEHAELKKEINWSDEFEAQATLESALAGDIDDVIAVSVLAGQCRGVNTNENQVKNRLSGVAKTVALGNPIPGVLSPGTDETLQFKNIADYEEFIWTQFARCQSTRGMFDRGLRERLAQMAESGNVNARYLYAMWVPVLSGNSSKDLIDWMTYQGLAMEFTWLNINEGQPLGLLAYGRSLEQFGHVYFTPQQYKYAPAFILAAYKCGLDNQTINKKVSNMTGLWKQKKMLQNINLAEDLSDTIVNTFCH